MKDAALDLLLGSPEMDPLTEADALQEAQLTEFLFDAVTMRAGLLFDLRQALQLRMGNTGLLVLEGVKSLEWAVSARSDTRTAWTLVGSTPENEQGEMKLTLFLVPDGEVHLLARGGAFYVGEVIGLPEAPPDFGSGSDDLIAAGMASMNSPFVPSHATFLEPLD
jgi:hypothetical protein